MGLARSLAAGESEEGLECSLNNLKNIDLSTEEIAGA